MNKVIIIKVIAAGLSLLLCFLLKNYWPTFTETALVEHVTTDLVEDI